jgi:N-acyl-D-amino-acid deacylase
MYDTLIRGGIVHDGLGGPAFTADVAIAAGRIAAIGNIKSPAREIINADGALVTPGFLDIHTHYDGQCLWDDKIDPSFSHGVTTVVAGNCGVGFAPVKPEDRKHLMNFMSGVEDIPGVVLDEGLDWQWRSFPEYLDRLAARRYTMDVAAHVTHAPLRLFTMGERALRHETATPDDIEAMCALLREAMAAGAAGFSTGRILEHRSSNGDHVPGTFAPQDELVALGRAMGEAGHGVFQVAPKGQNGSLFLGNEDAGRDARLAEHRLLETIATESGRPLTYGLIEVATDLDDANMMLRESDRAIARGVPVHPQISARGGGMLYMLEGYHIFLLRRSYREIAHLPLGARVEAMRDPARRRAILSEANDESPYLGDSMTQLLLRYMVAHSDNSFILSSPLDFEPGPERSLAALAAASRKTSDEYLYDHYTSGTGHNFNINFTVNYAHGSLETTRGFLAHRNVVSGLADGGAHIKIICDASMPTFQLAYWARRRTRGACLPLEFMINKLTAAPARLYSMHDRGSLELGKRADINVIDYDRLNLKVPEMVYDLPSGAGRLLQHSEGYLATLVAGVATRRHDLDTGARPGALIRNAKLH